MIVFVGSTNPVKINAVKSAFKPSAEEPKVIGLGVSSGVSEQPMSEQETRQGAMNRAKNAVEMGLEQHQQDLGQDYLGIGLEGGVTIEDNYHDKKMWETVWVALLDNNSNYYLSSGGKFLVPSFVAEQIIQGKEMGPIMSKYYGGRSVKTQEGLIGAMTKKFVDRTEMYAAIAKIAVGQWYGRGWEKDLDIEI